MKRSLVTAVLTSLLAVAALAGDRAGKPNAYIIAPADGQVVSSPVLVQFGLANFGVAPAGVEREGTGHHHLLVDVEELPDLDKPLPSDDNHLHFGGGQTQVELELAPGEHTLQLILGDYLHRPHDPPVMSKPITIQVK
mgnify:CR=1 FL=1|jgi:hypothetical protein